MWPGSSPRSAWSRPSWSPHPAGPAWSPGSRASTRNGPPCSCTATSTWSPPTRRTGRSTRSPAKSAPRATRHQQHHHRHRHQHQHGRRSLRLGPRRRGHEGHGRDDPRRGPPTAARRPPSAPRCGPGLPGRRGGGWFLRRPLPGGQPSRPVRGRHRGGRRGRRVQRHPRRPAPLPGPDGREGHQPG